MDIKQLNYFVAIVEHNFNLTATANALFVVQPTLSNMINDLEKTENVKIFKRSKNRIIGLTERGEILYHDALEVLNSHQKLRENLHNPPQELKGKITIGVPFLINTIVLSELGPKIIKGNPDIQFEIIEEGGTSLSGKLATGEIDIALLLAPGDINPDYVESHPIVRSEIDIVTAPTHKFTDKEILEWSDLHLEPMVTVDDSFMTNRLFQERIFQYQVNPRVVMTSTTWDYLIKIVMLDDSLFTILPRPLKDHYHLNEDCRFLPVKNPIPWVVTLCRPKKKSYSRVENYIFESTLDFFKTK